MLYEHRRPDVAVFIDFENVYVSVRDKLDANPNFESIMDRCNDLGRVVIARAYADWYRYPRITSALYANGVEPMYVPTYYYDKEMGRTGRAIKNSVDMNLCIDAMKTLFTNTNIEKFVLVTGDRDFIPLVNSIRQEGKEVTIIGIGGAASTHLAQSADEFIFYEQLVGKTTPARQKSQTQRTEATATATHTSKDSTPQEQDVYDVLVDAVHLVRERGYVSTLGSLKLVMKELMGGDFKESRYKDTNGRSFTKFKDFVVDAERRGKVQIFTSGTVNEVFLPGEDPLKLSQFAGDFKEETADTEDLDATVHNNGNGSAQQTEQPAETNAAPQPTSSSSGRSRRRRRPKRSSPSRQTEAARAEQAEQAEPSPDVSDTTEEPQAEGVSAEQESTPVDEAQPDLASTRDSLLDYNAFLTEIVSKNADLQNDNVLADLFAEAQEPQPDDSLFDRILADAYNHSQQKSLQEGLEPLPTDHEAEQEETAAPSAEADVVQQEEAAQEPEEATQSPEPAEAEEAPAQEAPAFNEAEARELAQTPEAPEAEAAEAETQDEAAPAPSDEAAQPAAEVSAEAAAQDDTEPAKTTPEAPASAEASSDSTAGEQQIVFTDDEWQAFRSMMAGFSKPVSFSQIVDNLKELRKQQIIDRRNEQLRTLVKQAIHNGMLERSGRGTRIYYKLSSDDSS